MDNGFLIPANSKRSMLYFSAFNKFDLILFGVGLGLSLILLLVVDKTSTFLTCLALIPGLVTGFLVVPVANYHNMLGLIKDLIAFFTGRRKYIWKGWCILDEQTRD